MIAIDIESEAIIGGSPLLPRPVGCAVAWEDGRTWYWNWGHPEDKTTNCTWEDFKNDILPELWKEEWVTHNGLGFDVEVLRHWGELPARDPLMTHDTMLMAFLHDPHARSLKLKDLANDWLGIPPDEQREMVDWIMENTDCRSRAKAGAHIAEVPGAIAGPYAEADTSMTWELFRFLQPLVIPSMGEAYDRERKLAPILAKLQHRGIRVDMAMLESALRLANEKLHRLTGLIRERLRAPDLDPGNDAQLGAALQAAGFNNLLTTPTGKVSVNKESLAHALEGDPDLQGMLRCRSRYDKMVCGFLRPWWEFAKVNDGRLHPTYSQTRNPEGYGTRTGRLSCRDPNFQQADANREPIDYFGEPYPVLRAMLLPEEGDEWVCGDYKAQEPRLTAHYESGALCEAYQKDPELDVYLWLRAICALPQTKDGRQIAKKIFLGLVYSMGLAKLSEELGISEYQAQQYRFQVKAGIPDVVQLDYDCKRRFQMGLPIKTLGGRLYHCEPPSAGRDWSYKALNTLIQGSAADMGKEQVVWLFAGYWDHETGVYVQSRMERLGAELLGLVHDELSISCPPEAVEQVKALMQVSANLLPADVPFLMDIDVGPNWAEAKP